MIGLPTLGILALILGIEQFFNAMKPATVGEGETK